MPESVRAALYRRLPSVNEVLRAPTVLPLIEREGQTAVAEATRAVLADLRNEITAGRLDERSIEIALSGIAGAIEREVRNAFSYSLQPVINATGVILHTNLGRAPLASTALDHVRETASAYSNLELDLETGERGKRDVHVDRLFRKLLQADETASADVGTIVVNNNAAAVLLALNTLAEGGEVIVSRGELVEIGGSFRIPDVMAKSGAILREVGTTNRTRISDYERAICEKTRLLLRVHRSNFQITGFTEQPSLAQITELAHARGLVVVEDLGSGALLDLASFGIHGEPGVLASIRAGVDLVTYSGDKLLGGPQAGLLSGRADVVARIRSNPMFRALRVDKLTYAVLEATLLSYVRKDHDAIPAVRMMRLSKEDIGVRAQQLINSLKDAPLHLELMDGESVIGGGAAPSAVLPTTLIAVTSNASTPDQILARLRSASPPILARVEEGRVLIDLRTVFPQQDTLLASALLNSCDRPAAE